MCKTVGVNVSQLIVRIRIAGALGNGGVLECALQSTVRIGGTGFQNVLIVRSTNAQEATGRTAESQGAVIGCIVNSTGLVRVAAAAGEHTGAGNCHCGEGGVLHKITTGESVRHDRSSFKGRYIQKALRRLLIK